MLFIAGVLLHRVAPPWPLAWLAMAFAVAAVAGVLAARRRRIGSLLVAGALTCTGLAAAQLYAFQFRPNDIGAFTGDEPRLASVEAEVVTPPRVLTHPFNAHRALPPKQVATVRVLRIKTGPAGWTPAGTCCSSCPATPPPRRATARVAPRHAPAARARDEPGAVRLGRLLPRPANPRLVPGAAGEQRAHPRDGRPTPLDQLRDHARRLLAAGFPAERALDHALLRALLLGDPDPQLRDVQDQFQRTGTSHHLAISGMHVAVLGAFVFLVCRALLLSPRKTALIMTGSVLVYGAAAMPSAPVVRSVLLCLAFAVGLASRRSVDALQLLAACVLAMLIYRPLDLYNAGFQLSFGTVLGLILFTRPLLDAMSAAWRDPDVAVARSFQKPTRMGALANWADGLLLKAWPRRWWRGRCRCR
jgi:ComEC/Rec2-related protein